MRNPLYFTWFLVQPAIFCIIPLLLVQMSIGSGGGSVSKKSTSTDHQNDKILGKPPEFKAGMSIFFGEKSSDFPEKSSLLDAILSIDFTDQNSANCIENFSRTNLIPISLTNQSFCSCEGCMNGTTDSLKFTKLRSGKNNNKFYYIPDWNVTEFLLNFEVENLVGGFELVSNHGHHVLWAGNVKQVTSRFSHSAGKLFWLNISLYQASIFLGMRKCYTVLKFYPRTETGSLLWLSNRLYCISHLGNSEFLTIRM